ncbi:4-diphosphocytidyl-2-C-methyl-D-erythritol kinase [hydrothermal vent metagenome]|uniref:4-(cytidine 5'-diphospho)-2-C-methyl-D-erythritol kinase n=1 Tax=hydrothermal vent metagenome TaxID=652676 RepID=A0A3B0S029_9ZZZZ
MIRETAPAKLNLYLHVGPIRRDGRHALASFFVFTEDGDAIMVEAARDISLTISGPAAGALSDLPPRDNLVWKAAELLREACSVTQGAAIRLEKNLPTAAGIGGGSADAAAALRALIKLWNIEIADAALAQLAFRLGADVPACLKGAPVLVAGAGEDVSLGPTLPPLWACLVNPGVEIPTGPVFQAFDAANPAPAVPTAPALAEASYDALTQLMGATRNDLQPAAIARAPEIADIIKRLGQCRGALAARMSGSGATCFALFSTAGDAERAKAEAHNEGWWAMASPLILR